MSLSLANTRWDSKNCEMNTVPVHIQTRSYSAHRRDSVPIRLDWSLAGGVLIRFWWLKMGTSEKQGRDKGVFTALLHTFEGIWRSSLTCFSFSAFSMVPSSGFRPGVADVSAAAIFTLSFFAFSVADVSATAIFTFSFIAFSAAFSSDSVLQRADSSIVRPKSQKTTYHRERRRGAVVTIVVWE